MPAVAVLRTHRDDLWSLMLRGNCRIHKSLNWSRIGSEMELVVHQPQVDIEEGLENINIAATGKIVAMDAKDPTKIDEKVETGGVVWETIIIAEPQPSMPSLPSHGVDNPTFLQVEGGEMCQERGYGPPKNAPAFTKLECSTRTEGEWRNINIEQVGAHGLEATHESSSPRAKGGPTPAQAEKCEKLQEEYGSPTPGGLDEQAWASPTLVITKDADNSEPASGWEDIADAQAPVTLSTNCDDNSASWNSLGADTDSSYRKNSQNRVEAGWNIPGKNTQPNWSSFESTPTKANSSRLLYSSTQNKGHKGLASGQDFANPESIPTKENALELLPASTENNADDGWASVVPSLPQESKRLGREVEGLGDIPRTWQQKRPKYEPECKEIDDVVQSMKSILFNLRNAEGASLSVEDDAAVQAVLAYHPKYAEKIGSGIECIKISRHSNFQEARCFWIVRKDGSETDFSYHKCLKEKVAREYPFFIEKYDAIYRRPRGRVTE